jgi:predicted nucleic acid-binding protein
MITIDANAVIKLLIKEENSDVATRLFYDATALGEPMFAPEVLLPEVINGLWKHLTLLKDINESQFNLAVSNLMDIWNNLSIIKIESVLETAVKVAKTRKIDFYDALYVAISISEDAPLFTFDRQIRNKSVELGLRLYNNL